MLRSAERILLLKFKYLHAKLVFETLTESALVASMAKQ
jgi:hypothetical protein